MTGPGCGEYREAFNEALAMTGVVLTKVDGDARGALSIRHITGKPIKFLGVGRKPKRWSRLSDRVFPYPHGRRAVADRRYPEARVDPRAGREAGLQAEEEATVSTSPTSLSSCAR